jgi:hypothetical protein
MIQLKNKKILFVSVSFFNYEKAIVSKLEELGAIVDFYDDRPSNSLINKGIVRLNKKLISSKINHYYKKILKEINQENLGKAIQLSEINYLFNDLETYFTKINLKIMYM